LIDHPSHDLPQCQLPFAGRTQRLFDPQASSDVVHSPDRTKGQPLLQRDRVLDSPQVLQCPLVAQRQPQCLDLRSGTMTNIGNRAVEDLAVGAIRLAQQMSRIGPTALKLRRDLIEDFERSMYFRFYIWSWQLVAKMATKVVCKSCETGKRCRFLALCRQ